MTTKEIYNQIKHRPFNYPDRQWKYYQEWNNVVFLHWEVDPKLIQVLLPEGIEVDTINGNTWVSIVAFDMNNIRLKKFPKAPYLSDFHEINIRVYVRYNNKPSVYFLSMEGSKNLSCILLRNASKLPYRFSKMNRTDSTFKCENSNFNDSFYIDYDVKNISIKKDKVDLWLSERYAVFQDYKSDILEYDVHHIEWPMQEIMINSLDIKYPRFKHLLNNKPDRIHYSKGVNVLTWDKKRNIK